MSRILPSETFCESILARCQAALSDGEPIILTASDLIAILVERRLLRAALLDVSKARVADPAKIAAYAKRCLDQVDRSRREPWEDTPEDSRRLPSWLSCGRGEADGGGR